MHNLRQLYVLQLISKHSSKKTMCAKENNYVEALQLKLGVLLISESLLYYTSFFLLQNCK